ncbi:DUF3853 family protein [Capnocytophaga leadbetteri]|uniref:DUF3853 family protein n=1 Tax=Capnocytophaga leadbetteri TaxID=327575 RepID=UPI0039655C50
MELINNTAPTIREQLIDIQAKIVKVLASLPTELDKNIPIELPKDKEQEKPIQKKYVYGIKGLADILGCSKTHAQNIKNSGQLDKFKTGAK